MPAEYDSPWKEALERFFDLVLAFFFPKLWAEIDWSQGYESLDTELRKILPEAAVGKRIADALVRAYTHGEGEGRDVRYLHAEIQCQGEDDFENRLDDYNSLFKLKLGHPVASMALLGDDDPKWRPGDYVFECGEFRKVIKFPTAKLLDYRGREEELERHDNPIGLLVAAHLLTLSAAEASQERADGKLRLLKIVLDRKMETERGYHFVRLIDWMVVLPAERQRKVQEQVRLHAKEDQMPFISMFEQEGFDRGIVEGEKRGENRGEQKGLRSGLLAGIEVALKVKFGAEGLALLPALQAQQDLAILRKALDAISPAASPDEVRRLLPSA